MKKIVLFLFSIFASTFFLLPQISNASSWEPYSISKYIGYGELLITDGDHYYKLDYDTIDCSFDSLDEDNTLYIDSILPSYGDSIYYSDDYGNEYLCNITTISNPLDFKTFSIEKDLSFDGILISDNNSYYIINTSYDCYFNSLDEGNTIYINSSGAPYIGDEIYYRDDYGSSNFCSINEVSNALHLYNLYITNEDVVDSTITAKINNQTYLIEYGYDCYASYWPFYENNEVYIDSLDSFLNTNDTLYNFYLGSLYGYDKCSINDITKQTTELSSTRSAANDIQKIQRIKKLEIKKRKVQIKWKKQSSAHYKIQVRKGHKKIKTLYSKKNKIWIKKLKPNTKYKIRIRPIIGDTKGPWSKWFKIKTKQESITSSETSIVPSSTNSSLSSWNNYTYNPYDSSFTSGITAQCWDGTYSYSLHRSGTCSHHGGVMVWY